ncbi:MAG TPA: hypothetical protein VF414_09920 [Thermoanaerobaculia bacterium]
MGLRYRDLAVDVLQMAPAPAGPCGCTATAPACIKSVNPNPRANCPKASAPKPPKKRADGLEQLRHQLRGALAGV